MDDIAWSRSEKKIATACDDGFIRIVDVQECKVVRKIHRNNHYGAVAAWSPSEKELATLYLQTWPDGPDGPVGILGIVDVASGNVEQEARVRNLHVSADSLALHVAWNP